LSVLPMRLAGCAESGPQRLQISAGAEVVAVSREVHHPHLPVLLELRTCLEQLAGHGAVDRVSALLSREDDATDRAPSFQSNASHQTAPGTPSFRASESGIVNVIRSSAVEKTFPCASVFSDCVPPPSNAPCSRKFSAWRFGNSKRSTSPV